MKQLLITLISVFFSYQAHAQIFNCSYYLRGKVHLLINLNNRNIVYSDTKLDKPVYIKISDIIQNEIETLVVGDLPAPWMANSSYRIRILQNSPFSVISYIGPRGTYSNIKMVCR